MDFDPNYRIPFAGENLSDTQFEKDFLEFEAGIEKIRISPPGNSVIVSACLEAVQSDLHNPAFPELKDTVDDFINSRPDLTGTMKAQLFWRVAQHMVRKHDPKNYGSSYRYPLSWQMALRTVLEPQNNDRKDYAQWEMKEVLQTCDVQTNIGLRYAAIDIVLPAYADKLPEYPTIVDAGCSAGNGQAYLSEARLPTGIRINTADKTLRRMVRDNLATKTLFAANVGFDKVISSSPDWANDCRYPEEVMAEYRLRQRFATTDLQNVPTLPMRRVWGNLLDAPEGMESVKAHNNNRRFSIATALTTLIYMQPAELPVAMSSLESLADTLMIVVDFAKLDPADPSKLVFNRGNINDKESKFRAFARLVENMDGPWDHLATFSNGRATQVYPTAKLGQKYAKLY